MTISQVVIVTVPLSRVIRRYSFLGLFRFGKKIKVDLKICCDRDGKVFYHVITGPPHLDYQSIFGESFAQAKNEALRLWNNTRRQSRVVIKPKVRSGPENAKSSFVGVTTRMRRSVDGAILQELKKEALIPKIEEIPLPPKPYKKQKTIEYRETDVAFGDTSKIYGRQTHSIKKSDQTL